MSIKFIKDSLHSILKEQKGEILTFEKDPIEYIIQKYPSLEATLIDLLTNTYKDYLTGIYVMAPKPTTFKILLHNGHSFYLIYNKSSYICKISGKKYHLIDIKDEEYATKAISNLLLLGIPPSTQGPDEEQDGEKDARGSFAGDMTSEPDLGDIDGDLDDLENTPDGDNEEEDGDSEEELQEEIENTPKFKRFKIIREIKINRPGIINTYKEYVTIFNNYYHSLFPRFKQEIQTEQGITKELVDDIYKNTMSINKRANVDIQEDHYKEWLNNHIGQKGSFHLKSSGGFWYGLTDIDGISNEHIAMNFNISEDDAWNIASNIYTSFYLPYK